MFNVCVTTRRECNNLNQMQSHIILGMIDASNTKLSIANKIFRWKNGKLIVNHRFVIQCTDYRSVSSHLQIYCLLYSVICCSTFLRNHDKNVSFVQEMFLNNFIVISISEKRLKRKQFWMQGMINNRYVKRFKIGREYRTEKRQVHERVNVEEGESSKNFLTIDNINKMSLSQVMQLCRTFRVKIEQDKKRTNLWVELHFFFAGYKLAWSDYVLNTKVTC